MKLLFMPYKYSMWDSMKSVYEAALQHPLCEAQVMPIPYYLKRDGKIDEKMIYEGEVFANEVEVVSYTEFAKKEKKYDVIIIHNPYDGANTVTSVEECFYSSELVKYTNHLVYIPYFINVQNNVDKYLLPGVKNAWRVFVATDLLRLDYEICNRNSKGKFIVTGSPKIDSLVRSCHNDEKWKHLRGKKVFLYNTHIRRVENACEELICEIQMMIQEFKNKKDIVLWWRPHPLLYQRIVAQKPSYEERFLACVNEVREMENGVYDEGEDLDEVLQRADAYMGEKSSVLDMMALCGKPVKLLDNVQGWTGEMQVTAVLVTEETIWFVSALLNCLCTYDMEKEKIEVVAELETEQRFSYVGGFTKLLEIGDWIWMIPGTARRIIKFNKKSCELEYIEILELGENVEDKLYFYSSVEVGSDIWILPYAHNQIIRINSQTNEVEKIQINAYENLNLISAIAYEEKIFAIEEARERMVCFDCNSYELNEYTIAEKGDSFSLMQYDETNEMLWIFSDNASRIYGVSPKTLQLGLVDDAVRAALGTDAVYWNHRMWISSKTKEPCIWKFDTETEKLIRLEEYSKQAELTETQTILAASGAIAVSYDHKEIMFFPGKYNELLVINENGDKRHLTFHMEEEDAKRLLIQKMKQYAGNSKNAYEDCYWYMNVSEFIKMVNNNENPLAQTVQQYYAKFLGQADGRCGERILDYIINEVQNETCHEA